MANYVAFLCSIVLLIVLLSYSDGHRHNERRNDRRSNDERQKEEKQDNDSSDSSDSSEEDKGSKRHRRNDERRNDEGRDDDSSKEGKITNYERRNDDSSEENKRSNDERRNDERRNDERRNDERRNDERRNNEKRNDDSSEEDKRSNDERRNDERRNDERRNNEKRNDDSSEEDRLQNFADKCAADKKEDWSYRGNNGPLMWTRKYSACGGRAQSPIAINSYKAIFHEEVEKLKFQNYDIPVERSTIENNGHTIKMTPGDDVERVIHFKSRTYRLKKLHFHWGTNKSHSSEHTIDTIHYALEMHLVHQSGSGRTAVVAVFFKEQRQASKELQNIIQKFPQLMYKDNSTELISRINLNNLLPANPASYYCYEGSLTTPPCTEGVQWLLLPKIMSVGTKQMTEFRKLYSSSRADSSEYCKISNNYRPLQALNGRTVVISQ